MSNRHPSPKPAAAGRLRDLLDAGTFQELRFSDQTGSGADKPAAAKSLVVGLGRVDSAPVCVFAQDASVWGGSLGTADGAQIAALQQYALKRKWPIIGIWDGGGARIQDGVGALGAFGKIFRGNVELAGQIPQISIVLGACAGGACYSPALTDFIIMVNDQSRMFLTGPDVTKELTGENVSAEQLGGCHLHTETSGVAHYAAAADNDAFQYARELISFLSAESQGKFEHYESPAHPIELPASATQPYDMRNLLRSIFDASSFLEVQPAFAPNLITGYARIAGIPVAVVANQPMQLAGALDVKAAAKGARFVTTSSKLRLPIATFVDVPGFLPGIEQEEAGIIHNGADLVSAYANAQVPLLTIITRKAFGGAFIALGSKSLGADFVSAWPDSQIGIMDAAAAIGIVKRRELANVLATQGQTAADIARAAYTRAYRQTQTPEQALLAGQIDAIIAPDQTRAHLVNALGNLPSALVDADFRPVTRLAAP